MFPVIEALTKRALPARAARASYVRAIVLHTTGDTDLSKVLTYYDSEDGLQPHWVIGWDGTQYKIADEDRVAWHCATRMDERILYDCGWSYWSCWRIQGDGPPQKLGGTFPGYASWRRRWHGVDSPLKLATGDRPNFVSVGIELLQPIKPTARIFTDEQYQSAAELVHAVCARHAIPVDAAHVLGHQDASPMQRCTASGGWDPGDAFDWPAIVGPNPDQPVAS